MATVAQSASSIAGRLHADAVVAAGDRGNIAADPQAAERRLRRRAVVGRGDGDHAAVGAERAEQLARSAVGTAVATGSGSNQAAATAPRGGHARAPAADDGSNDLAELGHRRDRERAAGRTRPVDGSKPIAA